MCSSHPRPSWTCVSRDIHTFIQGSRLFSAGGSSYSGAFISSTNALHPLSKWEKNGKITLHWSLEVTDIVSSAMPLWRTVPSNPRQEEEKLDIWCTMFLAHIHTGTIEFDEIQNYWLQGHVPLLNVLLDRARPSCCTRAGVGKVWAWERDPQRGTRSALEHGQWETPLSVWSQFRAAQ